jgi:hypothetical protein
MGLRCSHAGRTLCPVFFRLEEANYGTDFLAKPGKNFGQATTSLLAERAPHR